MLPESFRLQCKFSVTDNDYVPLGPMSLLFSRVRVISQGVLISDESYFDRLQVLHHQWMSTDSFKDLCAESFDITDQTVQGSNTHSTVPRGRASAYRCPSLRRISSLNPN